MNAQQIFDKVVTHLHTQGEQAKRDGTCAYRSEKGLKCAVGCLITERDYRKGMDPASIKTVLNTYLHLPAYLTQNQKLLSNLQATHDNDDNWTYGQRSFSSQLKWDLRAIAARYNLSTITLDALDTY